MLKFFKNVLKCINLFFWQEFVQNISKRSFYDNMFTEPGTIDSMANTYNKFDKLYH